MTREEIEDILRVEKEYLKREFYVEKIGLFGSYVRNEQKGSSDIDVLVEFSKPVGFEFITLKNYLEDLFNKPVDLVTVRALKPIMKEEILNEVQFQ
ncbi:nucleotidyltransferase family protein [Paenibacillus sp. IB182496]|uniref:Nucleotidyltransferase family protein n=1 Tax=Paenibacillus sabuli TaxID=2772509 RepID=A0A927BZA2_9BACL|nr:nucleotidyltransferase family protein [Paenibacillus sabuli]MBD2848631.1 nucleotidyltransferase family protein [Paenibacillus sabuli]